MRRLFITISLTLVGIISLSGSVDACVCRMSPTVYEEFARSHIVFTGKAVSFRDTNPNSGRPAGNIGAERFYTFDVDTTYKGQNEKSVEVGVGLTNTSCPGEFVIGQSYLVYARDPKGTGYATRIACGLVEEISTAGDQISLIKGILQNIPEPQVYGSLIFKNEYKENVIAKNTKVLLRSKRQTLEAVTDEFGVFRFSGVPKGNYSIVPVIYGTQRVGVADTQAIVITGYGQIFTKKFADNRDDLATLFSESLPGSVYTEFTIAPNYGVTGRVIDTAGKPATCEKVFLVNIASLKSLKDKESVTNHILLGINNDASSGWSWCKDDGSFDVSVGQKGEYVLAIEQKSSLFFHPLTDTFQNAEIISLIFTTPVKRDFKLLKVPPVKKK